MTSILPPIGTSGVFQLKSPFDKEIQSTKVYEVDALRRFDDVEANGIDVYKTYYQPFEISQDVYKEDQKNEEVIVTLTNDTTKPLYVPSSYINSFPTNDIVPYARIVLSVDLGMLPDSMDLSDLQSQVQGAVSDVIGVDDTVVNINAAASTDVITQAEHLSLQANREQAKAERDSDYARISELEADNAKLRQNIELLTQQADNDQ